MNDIKTPIKLDHFKALTDDTGILQHTKYSIPNRKKGYTTDDNARALVACAKFLQLHRNSDVSNLANTYLSFLFHMQRPDGKFHNLLSYDRDFLDDMGSEDCIGRSLWACGYTLSANLSKGIKTTSKEIFDKGFRHSSSFKSPRAKAFTILGLCCYYEAFPHDHNLFKNIVSSSEQLLNSYQRASSSDWRWFEPYLTYVNARLSQALFGAYAVTGDERFLHTAKESFDFLVEVQIVDEKFVPIGNRGWYEKGGQRAIYDQQPIEASCMVEASLAGFHATNEEKYRKIANIAFKWFLGKNTKNVVVYNSTTGACYDGINPQGLNLNQGAEATISYLLARLELEKIGQ
ncbi:MAG: glycosyltransferase [Candidatus Bathyarchaeota archaeon]|nr:glycosyltransferase [Candidatus Bathyarchaeota archaeon]